MDVFSRTRMQMIRWKLRMNGEWHNGGNSEWEGVNGTQSDQSKA